MRLPEAWSRRRLLSGACAAAASGPTLLRPLPAAAQASSDRMSIWSRPIQGFNIGTLRGSRHDADFFANVAATGARLTRLFLQWNWEPEQARYALASDALPALRAALAHARRNGLSVVLVGDFETEPNPPLWGHAGRATSFVKAWQALARELRDDPTVVGLDLLNEPNPPWGRGNAATALADWRALAERAVRAIRSVDAGVPIVFEGNGGGQAIGLRGLQPLADAQVVYSLHVYMPHAITHQRVSPRWPHRIPYPVSDDALLRGTDAHPGPWDARRLRQELADAVEFQQRSGATLFVGEFSCVRWAPGDSALSYIRDCVELFQAQRWSWTYHEFRGWPGWDAEVASNRGPVDEHARSPGGGRSSDAPVMQLLRRQFALQRAGG